MAKYTLKQIQKLEEKIEYHDGISPAKKAANATLLLEFAHTYKEYGFHIKWPARIIDYLYRAYQSNSKDPFFQDHNQVQTLLNGIKRLDLTHILLSAEEKDTWLLNQIPQCESLHVIQIYRFDEQRMSSLFKWLKFAPHVTSLDFTNFSFFYNIMDGNGRLRDVTTLVEFIKSDSQVEEIYFDDQPLKDDNLIKLINALKENPKNRIKHLNLFGCQITQTGCNALLEYIQHTNCHLESINLRCNPKSSCIDKHDLDVQVQAALRNRKKQQTMPSVSEKNKSDIIKSSTCSSSFHLQKKSETTNPHTPITPPTTALISFNSNNGS